jgi:hypothetical protein
MRKARKELHAMGQRLDDELAELADEMQDMRDEFHRLRAIEHAIDVEARPDTLLTLQF